MRKTIYTIFLTLLPMIFLGQQSENRPVRSPEQVAEKQTEMLNRELGLTPEQRDTIYKMHLKYAQLRKESEPRDSTMARFTQMKAELKNILNKEQYFRFMNMQSDIGPKKQYSRRMIPLNAAQPVISDSIISQ